MGLTTGRNGIWAGAGDLRDGIIEDCPAILGDDQDMAEQAYAAIEQAITDGDDSATIGDYTWTWVIIEDEPEQASYTTVTDARNALVNSGVLEWFGDQDLDQVAEWMWQNDATPEAAAEHYGVA